ncbi:MAG: L,D-transpeptidase [Oscillospiraceae bacterium]|jgi:hypothetical protein|nr:L,D-transpeptidase [Oscillospiraceae bacterium]
MVRKISAILPALALVATVCAFAGGERTDGKPTAVAATALSGTAVEAPAVTPATEKREFSIRDAKINLVLPETLKAGETMRAHADIGNLVPGETISCLWIIDGVKVASYSFDSKERKTPELLWNFTYTYDMADTADITVILRHVDRDGMRRAEYANGTVELENYDEWHYYEPEAERVLALVTSAYAGDFTTAWAEKNDYSELDKEVWVNAKEFTGDTEYLIWVSLTYQRLNVFHRNEAGVWRLERVCLVGTGAPGHGTPRGVWKTTYKQEKGWTTAAYTVKPVVRFKGGGYAMHSRLYRPRTDILSHPEIGYPMSHGCVRMLDEDIQYIFDNIPNSTTVVVY